MAISIFKFLSSYYGIELDPAASCSHDDIRKNFDFLEPTTKKEASRSKNKVSSGEIICVEDTFGKVSAYICPEEKVVIEPTETIGTVLEDIPVSDDETFLNDLCEIPTYKLRELLSKYKRKVSFYKVIKSELTKRGVYENKKYRLRKEITKMEESDIHDKYQRRREIKCKKS